MRFFVLLLIFYFNCFGDEILKITDDKIPNNTLGYTYYKTSNGEYLLANKLYLGIRNEPIYTKLDLQNTSSKTKQILLYHARAGTNYIDVDIYKDKTLVKSYQLGDMREQNKREILHRYSLFILDLEPNAIYSIYSKIENYGVYNIGWQIETPLSFFEKEQPINLIFGLLGGFLIFYMIFNTALFFGACKINCVSSPVTP